VFRNFPQVTGHVLRLLHGRSNILNLTAIAF